MHLDVAGPIGADFDNGNATLGQCLPDRSLEFVWSPDQSVDNSQRPAEASEIDLARSTEDLLEVLGVVGLR